MKPRLWIAALAAALALGAVAATGAGAGVMQANYEVSIKVKNGPPAFHGRVKSQNDFCASERPVKMKQQIRGHKDKVLGTGTTDGDGYWTIKVKNVGTGAYYAKAPAYGSASLGIQCVGAKSNVVAAD